MYNVLGNSPRTASQLQEEMESFIFKNEDKNSALSERELCRHVFDVGCQFLADNRLLVPGITADKSVGLEAWNNDADINRIGNASLDRLMEECKIPMDSRDAAKRAVVTLIAKAKACKGDNALFRTQHFAKMQLDNAVQMNVDSNRNSVYAPSLMSSINTFGVPSQEAFGANIDTVLPDIRASFAVTLLQFHRGLLDRILHRHPTASPYVKYVVPYAEVYDMLKSNDDDHKVRNGSEHRIPFIELYGDPRAVSNELQLIVPLVSNDTEGAVYSDGYLKFNKKANLFDLSRLANQLGKTHYNYTDLVSENVVMDSVIVKLTKGGTVEEFKVDLSHLPQARLQMMPNANDSGLRGALIQYTAKFTAGTKTVTGADSVILADCTSTDYLKVVISVAAQISLKYSDVEAIGNITVTARNSLDAAVDTKVAQLVKDVSVEMPAYCIDARYSEENLRKSNLAIRSHVRTFDFEINNGRNVLVDYSFNQELPDFLMSLVTEAISLGQDHRGIDIIVKELLHVYDVTNTENDDPNLREMLEKTGFNYVASQLVRPVVYLGTLDLANVDNIRSGDFYGDVRSYVENLLLNLFSKFYQNSFYKHQLNPGEKPIFKVFTSPVILENLFSIPHYHNHLNTEENVDGTTVEYRRVLPNGTILDCVTVPFSYMVDKIVAIPYRESNDEHEYLSWGGNWDNGTFVAHYNPQYDNAVNKRVFANSRTMVIPTNPSGIYLDVKNISKLIDMFQITNPTATALPQPSENLVTE